MVVIIDHNSYQLSGKLLKRAEVIGAAMNADKVRKAPLGTDGGKKLYLVCEHTDEAAKSTIIGSVDFDLHGSFLIATTQ